MKVTKKAVPPQGQHEAEAQEERFFDSALLIARDGKVLLAPIGDHWCLASRMKSRQDSSVFSTICQVHDLVCSEEHAAGSAVFPDDAGVLEKHDITVAVVSRGEGRIAQRSLWIDLQSSPTISLTPLALQAVTWAKQNQLLPGAAPATKSRRTASKVPAQSAVTA